MSSPVSQASPFVAPPERTPAAVAEALRPELRERFLDEYRAALDEAKATLDLSKVNEVVEEWWRTAWVERDPQFWQAMRWAEGTERGEPVDLDALRRQEQTLYELDAAPGVNSTIASLPADARWLLADVLDQVRADPWAGQPMRGWPPEFRTVLFGERGLLTYLIRERQRVVLLLSILWVQP